MAMTILPSKLLSVGESYSSDVVSLNGEVEFLFQAATVLQRVRTTSQVQITIEDQTEDPPRVIHTLYLNDTETKTFSVPDPPLQVILTAYCLKGRCVVAIDRLYRAEEESWKGTPEGSLLITNAQGEAVPIPPPPPSYYFGTSSGGELGYWPMMGGGGGGGDHRHVWNEIPDGTIDGVNTLFELSEAPSPPGSLQLFKNGLLMLVGEDFTLSGTEITFGAEQVPQVNNNIVASYVVS